MAGKFLAEVTIERIRRKPITGEITRTTRTFRGATLKEARESVSFDPSDDYVIIGNDQVEFWVKGLELVHE